IRAPNWPSSRPSGTSPPCGRTGPTSVAATPPCPTSASCRRCSPRPRSATGRDFAAVWESPPEIGGRYSALSRFGIVPALLAAPGDVDGLLAAASVMTERLRAAPPPHPGATLAAVLAAGVRAGRDKVTLVLADEVATFGLWLEQLLAESTGKD